MSRIVAAAALATALGAVGCLSDEENPAAQVTDPEAAANARPVVRVVRLVATVEADALELRARWESTPQAGAAGQVASDALVVAVSSRGADAVRDFARSGCFLACHDRQTGMPNWEPADGRVPMYLLPGFGGPLDVWIAGPGRVEDLSLGASGLARDAERAARHATPELEVDATGSRIGWDVTVARPLARSGGIGDVALATGETVDVALALYTEGAGARDHYVSLPFALTVGTSTELEVPLFLPGVTSWEFLVGAVVDRAGALREDDRLHGGWREVATGERACADCHRVRSTDEPPPYRDAGALERLVLRRGGVLFEPSPIGEGDAEQP